MSDLLAYSIELVGKASMDEYELSVLILGSQVCFLTLI